MKMNQMKRKAWIIAPMAWTIMAAMISVAIMLMVDRGVAGDSGDHPESSPVSGGELVCVQYATVTATATSTATVTATATKTATATATATPVTTHIHGDAGICYRHEGHDHVSSEEPRYVRCQPGSWYEHE